MKMINNLTSLEFNAFNDFLSHFKEVKVIGQETICVCPVCQKKKLYISVGEQSGVHNVLLNCFHNCSYKDILSAAGLEPKALYLTPPQFQTKEQCADKRIHIYNDKEGNYRFSKTIYKFHSFWEYSNKQYYPGDKEVYWEHFDYSDNKVHKGGSCRLLYHLDKITGDTVYIPEGEKDVETLEEMGYIATTNGGGAGEKWKKEYTDQLNGIKTAIILADNDDAGRNHARNVAESLAKKDIACKIVEANVICHDIQEKGDISDIVQLEGIDKAKFLLTEAVNNTELYQISTDTPTEDNSSKENQAENAFNADGKGRLSLANLQAALKLMDITIRHNTINHQIEYSGDGVYGMDPSGVNSSIPHLIYDTVQYYLKGCNAEKISSFLTVIAFKEENEYNPILEAINSTTWDGHDHLVDLYSLMCIEPNDQLSKDLLRKWLMQCYCGLYNTLESPFSLDLALVLVGKQGYGKTRIFEKLALSRKYFGEGVTLDPRDKDSRIQATSFWITELGEIGSSMKKEVNALKAFISNSTDVNRPPYGRTAITYPRKTSFCGTTNDMTFLVDETGNRRYATIKLPDYAFIDIKSKEFKELNPLQLWAQIATIVNETINNGGSYASAFRLTKEEQAALDERNKCHTTPMKGEQECEDILSSILTNKNVIYEYYTATEFKEAHKDILRNYSAVQIGKCLNKLGYKQEQKKIGGVSKRVYKLPSLKHKTQ